MGTAEHSHLDRQVSANPRGRTKLRGGVASTLAAMQAKLKKAHDSGQPYIEQHYSPPPTDRRNSLKECFFRKLMVGRPKSAIAISFIGSGVVPRKIASPDLIPGLRPDATTRGMINHAA